MNIGIDIRTLMDNNYSGVSTYTLNLLTNLLRLDQDNKYVLFYNSAHEIKHLPKFTQNNVWLVRRRFPNKILNYGLFKFLNYPRVDKLLRQEIDYWWMPHFNFIALPKQTKNILTVHDLSFLNYPEFFSVRKNFWHKMLKVKKMVQRFDQIIAISENTKQDLIHFCKVPEHKISVIYSAVDKHYQKITDAGLLAKIKQKYNLPQKFILYLGTIEPRKNIASIILAYNNLRAKNQFLADYHLVIAGQSGWKNKFVYQTVKKSPYQKDIHFLGYVANKNKPALYSLASLFVFPSFYEGFGFPPLEALACETPVIASFASSLPEVLGQAAILIDPYNIQQLQRAMEDVLLDKDLQKKLIQQGLEQIKKFTWQKTAQAYLNLFNKNKEN